VKSHPSGWLFVINIEKNNIVHKMFNKCILIYLFYNNILYIRVVAIRINYEGGNIMKKEPKTKILFTLPVDLKEELLKEADKENRSLNNYILTLLLKRVQ